ncbi:unnamed protein product [Paramecium pentaurelia]|uniref:PHD-type domain-containing protein n=1 Tax=Paramecium pentaurelia TaxID=43138 RepID=A0A8S1V1J6_9CILI|nr:unnamed protein product [Paramecium pentaurelia]
MSEEEKVNQISSNTVNELVKNDKYGHLIQLYLKKDPTKIKKYNSIQKFNKIYHVNQDVAVCALNDDIYSAKLIKIYCIKDPSNTYIPIIQVQWYYSKQDLKIDQKLIKCISDKELFFSTHSEYLPANKIQIGIKVLTFEEYSDLEFEEETIFFSRAAIDLESMEPRPNIKLWKKSCVCQLPQNPDLQMIQCDECENWYHLDCVELQDQDITKIDKYLCPRCNK